MTTILTFLTVGGLGYLVDVASFNALRSSPGLGSADPAYARVLAVGLAMIVTYLGNRLVTWRGRGGGARGREFGLFVVFNLIGLTPSVVTHDLLGFTSRLADNISANVIGLALGTLFRYWAYKRFVFVAEQLKQASDGLTMAADPGDATTDARGRGGSRPDYGQQPPPARISMMVAPAACAAPVKWRQPPRHDSHAERDGAECGDSAMHARNGRHKEASVVHALLSCTLAD
jgi:putative flippase GtrA